MGTLRYEVWEDDEYIITTKLGSLPGTFRERDAKVLVYILNGYSPPGLRKLGQCLQDVADALEGK